MLLRGGGLKLNLAIIHYKAFLFTAAIAASSSLFVYIAKNYDQYAASLVIHSYLNYWNDYIILLWLVAVASTDLSKGNNIVRFRIEFISVFILIAIAILLSASRASIVFLMCVFWGAVKDFKLPKYGYLIGIILSIFLIINDDRLGQKLESTFYGDSVSGRAEIWAGGIEILRDYLFFGPSNVDVTSFHSMLLEMLIVFGISSFGLILIVLISSIKVILASRCAVLSYGFFGFLLGPFSFNAPLRQLNILFILSLLVLLIVDSRVKSHV